MIEKGKKATVAFKGQLTDGYVFDEALESNPLEFTVGSEEVLSKFEDAVCRLNPGEVIKISIKAEDAFGLYDVDLLKKVDRGGFPKDMMPKIGQELELENAKGEKDIVTVKEIGEDYVLLDPNHPLAGEDLLFEIKLLKIS